MPMISICIATRNRPNQITRCIRALLKSSYQHFEIIIIDQSDDKKTNATVSCFHSKKIHYISMHEKGKAKALNKAILKARGSLLAFTDDDCIVAKNWLQIIVNSYRAYPHIAGVFGNTYPYTTPHTKNKICVATFSTPTQHFYNTPNIVHYQVLGQGNNMSIRSSAIHTAGLFKEWLGTGSAAKAGEESEMIFRLLMNKYTLMVNPRMVVYHNRWLEKNEYQLQEHAYTRGLFAFHAYYFFTSSGPVALALFWNKIQERCIFTLRSIRHALSFREGVYMLHLGIHEFWNGLVGLWIGLAERIYTRI